MSFGESRSGGRRVLLHTHGPRSTEGGRYVPSPKPWRYLMAEDRKSMYLRMPPVLARQVRNKAKELGISINDLCIMMFKHGLKHKQEVQNALQDQHHKSHRSG